MTIIIFIANEKVQKKMFFLSFDNKKKQVRLLRNRVGKIWDKKGCKVLK